MEFFSVVYVSCHFFLPLRTTGVFVFVFSPISVRASIVEALIDWQLYRATIVFKKFTQTDRSAKTRRMRRRR